MSKEKKLLDLVPPKVREELKKDEPKDLAKLKEKWAKEK